MLITDHPIKKLSDPRAVADIFREILASEHEVDRDKEHFWVVGLDRKNSIKYIDLVSLGALGHAIVHPRETFRLAIMRAVNTILVAHNHPSGDAGPSQEDFRLTETLKKSGEIIGISLIDHVIIGDNSYHSFRENGYL